MADQDTEKTTAEPTPAERFSQPAQTQQETPAAEDKPAAKKPQVKSNGVHVAKLSGVAIPVAVMAFLLAYFLVGTTFALGVLAAIALALLGAFVVRSLSGKAGRSRAGGRQVVGGPVDGARVRRRPFGSRSSTPGGASRDRSGGSRAGGGRPSGGRSGRTSRFGRRNTGSNNAGRQPNGKPNTAAGGRGRSRNTSTSTTPGRGRTAASPAGSGSKPRLRDRLTGRTRPSSTRTHTSSGGSGSPGPKSSGSGSPSRGKGRGSRLFGGRSNNGSGQGSANPGGRRNNQPNGPRSSGQGNGDSDRRRWRGKDKDSRPIRDSVCNDPPNKYLRDKAEQIKQKRNNAAGTGKADGNQAPPTLRVEVKQTDREKEGKAGKTTGDQAAASTKDKTVVEVPPSRWKRNEQYVPGSEVPTAAAKPKHTEKDLDDLAARIRQAGAAPAPKQEGMHSVYGHMIDTSSPEARGRTLREVAEKATQDKATLTEKGEELLARAASLDGFKGMEDEASRLRAEGHKTIDDAEQRGHWATAASERAGQFERDAI